MTGSRRRLRAAAPMLLGGLARAAKAADACADLDALPAVQKNLRKSLEFKVDSGDPKKRCGLCAFYTAAAGDCGKCQLFSNGPVGAGSICKSFALKKA